MLPVRKPSLFKCTLPLALLLAMLASSAHADEVAEKGRPIWKQHQGAVVTVQIVVKSKLSMSGRAAQANETRQNLTGTIVDPSGLTVLSLSTLDPGAMVQSMMSDDIKMETEISDVKILLEDGAEVAAEVVLRDRDLDLGFVRPKASDTKFQALDLANAGKAEVLDQVISLNRLGNAAGRAYSASVERISAIVQRPRLFYIPDANMTTTSLGSPAFTLDGKVLGVFVMRTLKGRGTSGGMFSTQTDNVTGIIVPAEYVLKAAKQAPASAPAEEKKADPEQK
ncbi:MAG TPA: serine protease [Clostridia bacterium]|nr:serine protease [Clostridia bacterium]